MRKRLTAILIALTIAISLLPMPAMATTPTEEAQIKAAVSKLVKDYAKKVYRPNADDAAFDLYFKHGFYGNHKDLILDESSPMVSALFNTCLLQEGLTNGITEALIKMTELRLDEMFVYTDIGWHNYYYNYSFTGFLGFLDDLGQKPDQTSRIGELVNTKNLYGSNHYPGPANENDSVMELLVGSMYSPIIIERGETKNGSTTFYIHLNFNDNFDFGGSYTDLEKKGYNTSKDDLLKDIGLLMTFMGIDEFFWQFKKTFTIEIPVDCDHGLKNYHFTYDGTTATVSSENGNGYTKNSTTKQSYDYTSPTTGVTTTRIYHELDDTVVLMHDRPWVMEWDQKVLRTIRFSPIASGANYFPAVYSHGRSNVWLYFVEYTQLPDGQKTETGSTNYSTGHFLGVDIKDKFEYSSKYTYTHKLENVVNKDGSNTIYLTIYNKDLDEIAFGPEPMDDHWTQRYNETERTLISTASDKLSGRDIVINYLGDKSASLGAPETVLDVRVWEGGKDYADPAPTYTAPTCTDIGGNRHFCPDCGEYYYTQQEAALGHDYSDYTDDGNATCTTDGTKTRTCARCGLKDTVTVEGSALGHDYGDYTDDGNTTCTVDGTKTRTCDRCGITDTVTMEDSAQGHKFGAYKFDHNSSCTADGTLTAVCEVCGTKDTVNADGSATGHNHKAVVTKPTCTEQGYTTYTCHCGDSYVDDYTEPTPHKEVTLPAFPSTCVEKGKTEGKQCELCGVITVPQTPTAYGNHTWDEGTVIKQPTLTEPGTLMYTCVNCSKTTHMSITELPKNGFDDVPADAYYAAAVAWAKANGITSGLSETLFGSDMSCTRGQVVTFLWAAAGRPEPKATDNPFTDVSENDYFYKPVLWAVENGITGGIGDGLFGPNETCTRGQIVTFLWASQGKPTSGSSTFSDVADTDWYAKSVVWAAENGVTGGIGNNQFGPNNTCTRAQVVTFLYKVYG